MQSQKQILEDQLSHAQKDHRSTVESHQNFFKTKQDLQANISKLKETEFKLLNDTQRLATENEHMSQYCVNSDARIKGVGYETKKLWQERRLQLKGNVRVFCRVRPVNAEDLERQRKAHEEFLRQTIANEPKKVGSKYQGANIRSKQILQQSSKFGLKQGSILPSKINTTSKFGSIVP